MKSELGDVLLTGATGFVGAHLLRDLLERTDVKVSCVVRGENSQHAQKSLMRRLRWYFPELDFAKYEARVVVLRGDLEAPRLGLDAATYERAAHGHRVVLNAAADVNHVGAASRSFRINTEAVASLIEFSRFGETKALHQVSTASVQGEFTEPPGFSAFTEAHLAEGQVFSGAYPESKFRAEVAVREAFAQGLPGAIYRVGYVAPHSVSGRYQPNIQQSNTARYVRACVRLGFVPYLPEETIALTPVDSVARAITTLLTRGPGRGETYYVDNPQTITLYDVVRVLQAVGYPIRLMEVEEFVQCSSLLSQDIESLTVVAPSLADTGSHPIATDSSWSQQQLRRLGFNYPRVTSAWLGTFLQHAIEVGFVEAPRFWNVGRPIAELL